MRRCAH